MASKHGSKDREEFRTDAGGDGSHIQKGCIVVLGSVPPPHHGSNIMCDQFVRTLSDLNHRVLLVPKNFSRNQREIGKLIPRKFFVAIRVFLRLTWLKIAHGPSLAICFLPVAKRALLVDALFLGYLRLLNVPYALYFHGKGYRNLAQSSKMYRLLISNALSLAVGGIVLGDTLKGDLEGFIPMDRLIVVPNMVPWKEVLRRAAPYNGWVQVLFLANIVLEKGPLEFLHAVVHVLRKVTEVKFVLAGPTRDRIFEKQILDFIREHSLQSFVEMPGGVYGDLKDKLFNESDIFVFPTTHETSPLVNLEAMRAGLPVISSYEGAIPEVVEHGVTGYLVDSHDAEALSNRIIELASNPKLRERMGAAGRRTYEQEFSPQAYKANVEKAMKFFSNLS